MKLLAWAGARQASRSPASPEPGSWRQVSPVSACCKGSRLNVSCYDASVSKKSFLSFLLS